MNREPLILQTKNKSFDLKSQLPKYRLMTLFSLSLIAVGIFSETPTELWQGTLRILSSPSNLMTDYLVVGNFGSAFFNSGVLTLTSVLLARSKNATVSGPLISAFFTVAGFSFFGKNLYNTIPIIIGVFLYSQFTKKPFSQYILVALFGSAISPIISYISFGSDFPLIIGIPLGYTIGIFIGFILPPLAAHFLTFHQGFSLYNVGFTAGIVGMFFTSFFRMFGKEVMPTTIISTEYSQRISLLLGILFLLLFILGFFFNKKNFTGLQAIFNSSGTLVTDFVAISGLGATLMNMAITGGLLQLFVYAMGGTFSGPILGGILTVVGFSAFGNHWKNSLPILAGVVLAAKIAPNETFTTFSIVLTAIFGTTLAPISGYYGPFYGVLAGYMHMTLVSNVAYLHGGLNLYNNGFSGGFVAAFMVPLLDIIRQEKKGGRHVRKRKV